MNPFIDRFLDRPKGQKIAFWVISLTFITYVFWQFFYAKLVTEQAELEERVQSLETEKTNEQRVIRDLPKLLTVVKDLEAQLKKALLELPDKREIPDLLASIERLAKDAGLNVTLFEPKPENFKDFYAEIPVKIEMEGTYHQVASFYDEVGRLPRIVNVSEMAMSKPLIEQGMDKVPVSIGCLATTFRYLEESERPKADDGTDKGKKKKK